MPPLLLPLLLFFFSDFKNVSSSTKSYFKASSDVAIPCLDCISIVKCTFSYSALNTFFPIFSTSFRVCSVFSFRSSTSSKASRLARRNSIRTNCASFRRAWNVSRDSLSSTPPSLVVVVVVVFRRTCSRATVLTFSITRARNAPGFPEVSPWTTPLLFSCASLSRTRRKLPKSNDDDFSTFWSLCCCIFASRASRRTLFLRREFVTKEEGGAFGMERIGPI